MMNNSMFIVLWQQWMCHSMMTTLVSGHNHILSPGIIIFRNTESLLAISSISRAISRQSCCYSCESRFCCLDVYKYLLILTTLPISQIIILHQSPHFLNDICTVDCFGLLEHWSSLPLCKFFWTGCKVRYFIW